MLRLIPLATLVTGVLMSAPVCAETPKGPDLTGLWCLTHWAEPEFPGKTYHGWLRIDPPGADGEWTGEMFIEADSKDSFARQSMVFDWTDDALVGVGTLQDYTNWGADRLTFRQRGNLLVGTGLDVNNETSEHSFARGDCVANTS